MRDNESGQILGTISEEELQALVDHLEEVDEEDQDYWIDIETIDFLEGEGAPAGLIQFLRRAVGDREGIELAWSRG